MNILEAKNITKQFPGVLALDSVDITFKKGEIHCIIGENGAGKSTLIKCLTGVYTAENGQILINGTDTKKNRSMFEKIAYVPQEIDLFGHMSVAENIFMPFEKSGFNGVVNQKLLQQNAIPLLKKFKLDVNPDDLIKDISVSAQQLIQSIRAIAHEDYEVLILDEPTTSLTTEDAKILFDFIREIKNQNKSVIFISHKLEEIFELGDVITIFKNGQKVAYSDLNDATIPWIITKMTGRNVDQEKMFYSENISDEVLLEVDNLTGADFTNISFKLNKGEILGFSGLVGSGRTELMQAIFGYLPVYSGSIKLEGKEHKTGDTNYSVSNGFFYLPEDRKAQGILPMLSIRENISASNLDRLKNGLFISSKKEKESAEDVINTYDIKTPDSEKAIKFLSGGNQQKVIIGRSMICNPKVLVFDEPTKGIDVGTKAEIYRLMKELAEEKGIGIILISSEMDEVKKCSNRIIALYGGKKYGEFPCTATKEELLNAIIGVKSE